MLNDYELIIRKTKEDIDYFPFIKYLFDLEEKGIITLFAGTYSLKLALEKQNCENADFYFYFKSNNKGFCFSTNRFGTVLKEDDKLFNFSHRYLYNNNHLSNCFFGEKDFRSGEFFKK